MRYDEFRKWMKTATKENGELYAKSTQYDYPSRVKRVEERERFDDIDKIDLDDVINRYERAVNKTLSEHPNPPKYKVSTKTLHDHLCALKKYREFCL